MKTFKLILIGICIFSFTNINAQHLSQKQIARKNNKVALFTTQEFSNLHIWFYNQVLDLKLSNEVEDQYAGIISKYTYRMSRLDDKDSDYSYDEILKEIPSLINEINKHTKPLFTDKQYNDHLKIMTSFEQTVLNKLALKNSQDIKD
ncbi:MAG: hypothetical protein V7719_03185 [Psychroserpens sp.]|uniref:hypothetical protein n=1 Tax=Psychroserpens sp. TaxID=2020870 RepID=UPI003001AA45